MNVHPETPCRQTALALLAVVLAAALAACPARAADEASVKQRLTRIEDDIKTGSWNQMQADIEVCEEWIKDLPEAARAPLSARLAPLRKQYEAHRAKDFHDNILKMIRSSLDHSKTWIAD